MTAVSTITKSTPNVTPVPPPPGRRKRTVRLAVLLLALTGGVVGGGWYWSVGRFLQSTDNAYVQGDIAVLSAQVDGHVAAIRVTDNQAVRAGDTMIELDGATWRAALAQAEGSLAETVAAIAVLQQQVAAQEAQIDVTTAQAAQAQG